MWQEDHCSTTVSCGFTHVHMAFNIIILKA